MTSSSRAASVVLLAAFALAGAAHAQQKEPTPADLETARDLYKQGRDLEKKGDLKGALEKLRAAHAVGRTPLTAIELARVEVQLGMVVEAREVCLGVARMPVASDESARSATARKDAAKLAEDLKAKVATIIVQITGVATTDHVNVSLDGIVIPDVALAEPRKVNPGKHVLVAHVDGGTDVEGSVEVGAAETKTVTLSPPPAPVATKPPPPQPLPYQPLPPQPYQRPVTHGVSTGFAIVGFSFAALGLIGGTAAGVVAMKKSSSLDDSCPSGHCAPNSWNTLDSAHAWADASTALFFIGGTGLLVGTLAIALRSSDRPATISPRVGLGTLGVDGAF